MRIVIPAHNEAAGLDRLLPELRRALPQAAIPAVDDASSDDTVRVAEAHGARVQRHPCQVVGARSAASQASRARWFGKGFCNRSASWTVGKPAADLTSGFRAVRAARFREFLFMLPNGCSRRSGACCVATAG